MRLVDAVGQAVRYQRAALYGQQGTNSRSNIQSVTPFWIYYEPCWCAVYVQMADDYEDQLH